MDRAILVGGTGIGMSIVANKFKGVRAALCHDELSIRISRCHNDANVLCLSTNLFCEKMAAGLIEVWLDTPFEGGRHARRIAKIAQCENSLAKAVFNQSVHQIGCLDGNQSDCGLGNQSSGVEEYASALILKLGKSE